MQVNEEVQKYINKLISSDPAVKSSLNPKEVFNKLKQGYVFHQIIGEPIPNNLTWDVYNTIEQDELEEVVYGKNLYYGSNNLPGLKDYLGQKGSQVRIEIRKKQEENNPKQQEIPQEYDDDVYDKETPNYDKKDNKKLDPLESTEDQDSAIPNNSLIDNVKDKTKDYAKESLAKEATKQTAKKTLENTAKQRFGQAALAALRQAGAKIATAVATRNPVVLAIIGIIGVIILIFLVIFVAACIPGMGRNSTEPAKAVENSSQFKLIAAFEEKDLKDLLDKDLDKFKEKIEKIKKEYSGDNKKEIEKICDDIIKEVDELKKIIPQIQIDEKNRSQEAPERDKVANAKKQKYEKKDKILKLTQDLIKKITPKTPCFYQPESGYCGQTSTMMMIATFNPTFPIKQNSSVSDYANVGSTYSGDDIIGLATRHLPNKKIVQVNTQIGTNKPNYEPLYQQALKNNPVVIATQYPPYASYKHFLVVTGYAGEKNGERQYYVNNPAKGKCEKMTLAESYFRNNPYPGPDYWYMYAEDK